MPTMKIVYLCTDINNSIGKCLERTFLMLLPIFPILSPSYLKASSSPNEKTYSWP